MRERPILMKPELVRATLDGSKTQTRRVIKPQPTIIETPYGPSLEKKQKSVYFEKSDWAFALDTYKYMIPDMINEEIDPLPTPYGKRGDILWVRETWCEYIDETGPIRRQKALYKADLNQTPATMRIKWKPSIFMPKKYCRLRLKITDIRVERVQDISEGDAIAEGVVGVAKEDSDEHNNVLVELNAVKGFRALWDKINLKRGFGWEKNPWVWVLVYEKM